MDKGYTIVDRAILVAQVVEQSIQNVPAELTPDDTNIWTVQWRCLEIGDLVSFPRTNITAAGEGVIVRFIQGNPRNIIICRTDTTRRTGRSTTGETVTRVAHNCR